MDITNYYDVKILTMGQKIQVLIDKLHEKKKIDDTQHNALKSYTSNGMLLRNCSIFDGIMKQYYPKNKLVDGILRYHDTDELLYYMEEERSHVISMTQERKDAIKQVFETLMSTDLKMFGMYGYAGTGKTTLMMEIVYFLMLHGFIKSVALTAPTHKALNIMKTNFSVIIKSLLKELNLDTEGGFEENLMELRTNGKKKIEFKTIHSLLGYAPNLTVSDGEKEFVRSKTAPDISDYDLIIIDECSMIPLQMIVDLLETIRNMWKKSQDYTKLPKMIFSGDPAQLPPVNEVSSSIFIKGIAELSKAEFAKKINVKQNVYTATNALDDAYTNFIRDVITMKTQTLKQIFRNKKSNIMDMCFNIRQWVIGDIGKPTIKKFLGNGAYAYQYKGGDKTDTAWFKKCIETFKTDNTSNIILTWTNRATDTYNQALRLILRKAKKGQLKRFEQNDIIILNDFYSFSTTCDDTEASRFYTSEQFKVTIATESELTIKPMSKSDLIMANRLPASAIRKYNSVVDEINKKTCKKYKVWKLEVIRLANNTECESNSIAVLNVMHESSEQTVKGESDQVATAIRILYRHFQINHAGYMSGIEKYMMKPLWEYWNSSFNELYASVIYGYSITTHKAQGSTFNNVFVDADDICLNRNMDEVKRCIYTSHTRSANDLHILI